jgi:polyisoprenoid-binding protein YceI
VLASLVAGFISIRPGTITPMTIQSGTHEVGPDSGSLKIKTGREGAAAKAGHDLVLGVNSWSGSIDVEGGSVELTADPGSVEVESGSGGAKPLTDKDKVDIKKSISEKVLGSDQISFKSDSVENNGNQMIAKGDLSIAGKSNSVSVPLSVGDDGTVSGSISLSQKDYGIKQYSAMFGALKVKDQVEVLIEAKLPSD